MKNKISVDWNKCKKLWRVRIRLLNGNNLHFGYYDNKVIGILDAEKYIREVLNEK